MSSKILLVAAAYSPCIPLTVIIVAENTLRELKSRICALEKRDINHHIDDLILSIAPGDKAVTGSDDSRLADLSLATTTCVCRLLSVRMTLDALICHSQFNQRWRERVLIIDTWSHKTLQAVISCCVVVHSLFSLSLC